MIEKRDDDASDSPPPRDRVDSAVRVKEKPADQKGGSVAWFRGKEGGPRAALAALAALLTIGFALYARWLFSVEGPSDAIGRARAWLDVFSGENLAAVTLAFGPFAVLLALVIGLLVHYGMPQVWQTAAPSLKVGSLLGACLAAAWFIGTARMDELRRIDWLFFVPVVPPALLVFQALITWRQRPRSVGAFHLGVSAPVQAALEESGDARRFDEVHDQLVGVFGGVPATFENRRRSSARAPHLPPAPSGLGSFATHFAVPSLLLLLVGFGALALAVGAPSGTKGAWNESPVLARGLQWGVAGAYVYVLVTFGSRSFRNDLTVGATVWAIITLIVGPALAVVLALGWKWKSPASGEIGWQTAIVLFFAGLAPRQVMNLIEAAALLILKAPAEARATLIPLTKLRGISSELAVRLKEENIEDVIGLAYADPIRLVQSVPYDLRQVVEWIDQAQLAVALPDQHEVLTQRGVTGAIDLAWRWLQACEEDPNSGKVTVRHAKAVPDSFKRLVREERDAAIVYDTARQMFYEEHVRLLWVMYNCFSTAGASSQPQPAEPATQTPNQAAAQRDEEPVKKAG
jgi:hypothetical protein